MTLKQEILAMLYRDLANARERMNLSEANLERAKSEYHQSVDHFNTVNDLIGEWE